MTKADRGKDKQARSDARIEIFEIHPVILGGDPTDSANKTLLTRAEHIEAVHYWNAVIQEVRTKARDGKVVWHSDRL